MRPNLSPFPVDPAVLAAIRPMQNRDAEPVAALHEAAMGSSLWAQLGRRFLVELYRGLVDSPYFLGFVYEEDGVVKGFIAGSIDAEPMMRTLMRSRALVLGAAAAAGVLQRPQVLARLSQTLRYFKVSDAGQDAVPAESLFCSFAPELRGKRVSGHINKVLFDDLLARGHSQVKITTEVDNEGANRQLRSWGFEPKGEFNFYGKKMVRYVLNLGDHPRVQPVSRHPLV